MLIAAFFVVVAAAVLGISTSKSKFNAVLSLYFFSVAILIIASVLYTSKISMYKAVMDIDYSFYKILTSFKCSFESTVTLFNIGMSLFMFSALILKRTLYGRKNRLYIFLMCIPILYFLFCNSPKLSWYLYLKLNSPLAANSEFLLSYFIKFNRIFSNIVFWYFVGTPLITLVRYMAWTKIKKNKEYARVCMLLIILIDAYVYIFFWRGIYFNNLINQVDLIKFPTQAFKTPSYIIAAIIIFTILTTVIFINIYFKPFINFTIVKKNEIAKVNNALDKNFRMLLHIYKNSFVGIEKLSYMGGEYIKKGNNEKAGEIYGEIYALSMESIKRISQVLDLLREVDADFAPFHIYECIDKAIVKAAFGDEFILEKNYMSENDMVLGDKFHITEAMLNLFINAREACADTEHPKINISTFREGNLIVIEITDNGCGIKKEDLKKIFRTFYSTKPRSQCGGIGINYAEKVMIQHHGGIDVKSQPGEYTTFQVYLPLVSEKYAKG